MITVRKIIAFAGVLFCLMHLPDFAFSQKKIDTAKLQQAGRYYQEREFEKAAVLYKEIFEISGSQHYFVYYLNCLIELSKYDQAEKEIKKEIRRTNKDASLYVQWGALLKQQNRFEEASDKFESALKLGPKYKSDFIQLANSFISKREFEWAEKVYLLGRNSIIDDDFNYELARVYLYQRNYEQMLAEYLELLKKDENNLSRVQSSLRSALRSDVDDSLQGMFRQLVLKSIQAEPGVVAYNRLLIWLFTQEEMYSQALRQTIALDKRSGQEDLTIAALARVAGNNHFYGDAIQAYDYIIEKGVEGVSYYEAQRSKMQLLYQQYILKDEDALSEEQLEERFESTLAVVGENPESVGLLIDFAHFLAFYEDKPDQAVQILEEGRKIPRLQAIQRDFIKNELADISVYKDDLWEAVLLYSQLIEANRDNELGDEVKLKKARLGYFMGNLSWAKALLNVIKAGTSKLVANDALELSLFISNNSNLDTTEIPLQQFARADLYTFRNQGEKAWAVLDSIETNFPRHSLTDDVLFRKAKIKIANGDFQQAAAYLEEIVTNYSYELLADDALFQLAGLYENQLMEKEKAEGLYKKMLVQYPASIYVTKSREKYRELRGDFEDDKETEFFEGGAN
ncbi:tetratricopeptide repeat protein [Sunxiuqinia sp. A32]|uniref:tetratricopeptide repeat protein n=1 Tax=Sunxiuqinia sp. A32 TaxID=3461496 RepID=UPI0040458BE0